MTKSILFVCTGNICRSPTADGVMRALAPHLTVDSAGTHAYHIGEAPDARTVATAKARGYDLSFLRARKVTKDDFQNFDVIAAMDAGHYEILQRLRPKDATAQLVLFCEFAGLGKQCVPDPYYGSQAGFETCFDLVEKGCREMLLQMSQ